MDITIKTDYIKLNQLLKLASITGQGSDAMYFIENNLVTINGEVIKQRGKKVYKNTKVLVADKVINVL